MLQKSASIYPPDACVLAVHTVHAKALIRQESWLANPREHSVHVENVKVQLSHYLINIFIAVA